MADKYYGKLNQAIPGKKSKNIKKPFPGKLFIKLFVKPQSNFNHN